MRLPGGLVRDCGREREATAKELDGHLELVLAPTPGSGSSLPARVTRALAAWLASFGGAPAGHAQVDELCVADRQFLMHRLAEALGLGRPWITARCERCSAPFDFEIAFADLPVREAGPTFPFAEVETSAGTLRARVPSGADQAAVTGASSAAEGARALLARCLLDGAAARVDALTADDLQRIDEALEAVSPAVVTRVEAACPACDQPQVVPIDPYLALRHVAAPVLDDVHRIASVYHWAERDILALERARRHFYLERIDRGRGLVS